jgi:2-dehydropantoate 2-reductase
MLQDLRRGHATEIDYMNGAVAALGAEHGVPCPVNHALTAIIKAMEAQARLLFPKEVFEAQSA